MKRNSKRVRRKKAQKTRIKHIKLLSFLVGGVILAGLVWMLVSCKVLKRGRFNFVVFDNAGKVALVSLSSVDKSMGLMELPKDLMISSRSVGEYRVDNLYKLASYDKSPGVFVRRKVQGFLRVPVSGYLQVKRPIDLKQVIKRGVVWRFLKGEIESDLSFLDIVVVFLRARSYVEIEEGEKTLLREGVLVKGKEGLNYNRERLSGFVEERYFDWLVGEEKIAVSVVDRSGLVYLGEDVSDFIKNLGARVVLVREEDQEVGESFLRVENEQVMNSETVQSLREFLNIQRVEVGEVEKFRAKVVLFVGDDMENLF